MNSVNITQLVLMLSTLTMAIAGLLALARLLWCAGLALQARRGGIAALSLLAAVGVVALFAVVAAVWFGYALAHTQKSPRDDLVLALATQLPFLVACYVLWRLARRWQAAIRRGPAEGEKR